MQQPYTQSYEAPGNFHAQNPTNHLLEYTQSHLGILLHARSCLENEQAAISCPYAQCREMRRVLMHLRSCDRGDDCKVDHCASSFRLLRHWDSCQGVHCPYCPQMRDSRNRSYVPPQNAQPQLNSHYALPKQSPNSSHTGPVENGVTVTSYPHNRDHKMPSYHVNLTNLQTNGTHWQDKYDTSLRQAMVEDLLKKIYPPAAYSDPKMEIVFNYMKDREQIFFETSKTEQEYKNSLENERAHLQAELANSTANFTNGASSPSATEVTSGLDNNCWNNRNRVDQKVSEMKADPLKPPSSPKSHFTSCLKEETPNFSLKSSQDTNESNGLPKKPISQRFKQELPSPSSCKTAVPSETKEYSKSQKYPIPPESPAAKTPLKPENTQLQTSDVPFQEFIPLLDMIINDQAAEPFRNPVPWKDLGLIDYLEKVTHPMDLSTIKMKLTTGQYQGPWDCIDDFRLMLKNAWLYNKKSTRVYKSCTRLAELFESLIDPVMKSLGYCCGQEYVFYPHVLTCLTEKSCNINRDAYYYVFDNTSKKEEGLLWEKYIVCERCFLDSTEKVAIDDANSTVYIEKSLFEKQKNSTIVQEPFVNCRECGRKWHKICACYMDEVWPNGYVCPTCLNTKMLTKAPNRYTAKRLPTCHLSNFLEKRVNDFMKKKESQTNDVIIRILSSQDKVVEVKKHMRKNFCGANGFPDSFPYRMKVIFAFQENDGQEVCFFGLYVQEFSSECPLPNKRRVYIAYLDSVYFFQPKQYRTDVYHEILVGYLEYVKHLGFVTAHIWACPPGEGDDYIFHMHPVDQKIPKPRRLQEWYEKMLVKAHKERIVVDYNNIFVDARKTNQANATNPLSATDLPYFEGDFWPNALEDLFKSVEETKRKQQEEKEQARDEELDDIDEDSNHGDTDRKPGKKKSKKRKLKRTSSVTIGKRKRLGAGGANGDPESEVGRKLTDMLEKNAEAFLTISLQHRNQVFTQPIKDPDPLLSSELIECRDVFLSRAREKHLEFSTLRRAKYSTLSFLYDLHTENRNNFMYSCNTCSCQIETRYQCKQCADFHLCEKCYTPTAHEHEMRRVCEPKMVDDNNGVVAVQQSGRNLMERYVELLEHANTCRDANCRNNSCAIMKKKISHFLNDNDRNNCDMCKYVSHILMAHSAKCHALKCPVAFCDRFKAARKKQESQQRLLQVQNLRRRQATMQRYNSKTPQQPNTPQPPPQPQSQQTTLVGQQASPSISQCTPPSSEPPHSFSSQNSLTSPHSVPSRNSPIKSANTPLHQPPGQPISTNKTLPYSHSSPYTNHPLPSPKTQSQQHSAYCDFPQQQQQQATSPYPLMPMYQQQQQQRSMMHSPVAIKSYQSSDQLLTIGRGGSASAGDQAQFMREMSQPCMFQYENSSCGQPQPQQQQQQQYVRMRAGSPSLPVMPLQQHQQIPEMISEQLYANHQYTMQQQQQHQQMRRQQQQFMETVGVSEMITHGKPSIQQPQRSLSASGQLQQQSQMMVSQSMNVASGGPMWNQSPKTRLTASPQTQMKQALQQQQSMPMMHTGQVTQFDVKTVLQKSQSCRSNEFEAWLNENKAFQPAWNYILQQKALQVPQQQLQPVHQQQYSSQCLQQQQTQQQVLRNGANSQCTYGPSASGMQHQMVSQMSQPVRASSSLRVSPFPMQQLQQQHKPHQSNWAAVPVSQQLQDRCRSMPSNNVSAVVANSYFSPQQHPQQQSVKMQGYPQPNPAYGFSRADDTLSPPMQQAMIQQQQPRFSPPGGGPHAFPAGSSGLPPYPSPMEMGGTGSMSRLSAPMQMRSHVPQTAMLAAGGGGQVRHLSNASISQTQQQQPRPAFPPQHPAMLSQLLGPGQMGATPSPSNTGSLSQSQTQPPTPVVMRSDFHPGSQQMQQQQPPQPSAMMHHQPH